MKCETFSYSLLLIEKKVEEEKKTNERSQIAARNEMKSMLKESAGIFSTIISIYVTNIQINLSMIDRMKQDN